MAAALTPARGAGSGDGGLAAWLVLSAPGMLVTRALVVTSLVAAPWLSSSIHVETAARVAAAALLPGYVASTLLALRRPGAWSLLASGTLLAVDAWLCGFVLGADLALRAPGLPLTLVVLALGFEMGGAALASACAVTVVVGTACALWIHVGRPLVFAPRLLFATRLSVENQFAGVPAVRSVVTSMPTALHVETTFGGEPAEAVAEYWVPTTLSIEPGFAGGAGMGSGAQVFLPALAVALWAICAGSAVTLWRARAAAR